VCWKPCSSCWSLHLLREEFLSAPIHSPLSGSPYRSFGRPQIRRHRASSSSQGGCSYRTRRRGGRLRLLDEGTRRAAAVGSATTAPCPAAAPRHEVRGERRGEEGGGAAQPAEGRRGWQHGLASRGEMRATAC
jgi:hypothetical protein